MIHITAQIPLKTLLSEKKQTWKDTYCITRLCEPSRVGKFLETESGWPGLETDC